MRLVAFVRRLLSPKLLRTGVQVEFLLSPDGKQVRRHLVTDMVSTTTSVVEKSVEKTFNVTPPPPRFGIREAALGSDRNLALSDLAEQLIPVASTFSSVISQAPVTPPS